MDDAGFYNGVDFERDVYEHLGLGSRISDAGVIEQRSDRIPSSLVERMLNAEWRDLRTSLAAKAPERVAVSHDFTYPADAERMYLRGPVPTGERVITPPLAYPWLDLLGVQIRDYDSDVKPPSRVDFDDFYRMNFTRWTFHNDAFYYSEQAGE
ncbi:MAG: hypothetical protein AABY11_00865, partial [archaeon]